jgi:hypothetical protein
MKTVIESLNAIGANVWAVLCILAGVLMCAACLGLGKTLEPGTLLIGGGLALLQRNAG